MENNNLTEQEKDYLTNILKAEMELNRHLRHSYREELNDTIQSIMNKLNTNNKNNEL
jgi:Spy/CpxP family protein refolding chaperone